MERRVTYSDDAVPCLHIPEMQSPLNWHCSPGSLIARQSPLSSHAVEQNNATVALQQVNPSLSALQRSPSPQEPHSSIRHDPVPTSQRLQLEATRAEQQLTLQFAEEQSPLLVQTSPLGEHSTGETSAVKSTTRESGPIYKVAIS